jgi:hypothetical protein
VNTEQAIATAAEHSAIPPKRLRMMLEVCEGLPPGSVVQCGVGRGGSGALLGWATGRELWLFDRFVGMPEPGELDGPRAARKWHPDWCAATIEDVGRALAALDVPPDRVRILGGDFADTLHVNVGPVALLHLDADWYESTKLCLARFLPDVVPGGAVIVDDYHHWPGCKLAVDEYSFDLHEIDGTAVWFRIL